MWVTNITELVDWKTAPFCNRLELATQIYITITVSCDSFPLCSCFQNRHFVFSTISSEQHIAKKTSISPHHRSQVSDFNQQKTIFILIPGPNTSPL